MPVVWKHKTCKHTNCKKQPIFNEPDQVTGMFCADHKKLGMIDVVNKLCEERNCDKRAVYNKPGTSKGRFCATHKEIGMIDIQSKRCLFPNCDKLPSFNKPGEITAIYCVDHKTSEMINVKCKRLVHNRSNCVFHAIRATMQLFNVRYSPHDDGVPGHNVWSLPDACSETL